MWSVAVLVCVAFGCGGGGGGGSTAPSACVAFTSSTPNPGPATVTAQDGAGSTCTAAQVIVTVTDVDNVFGAGFDLVFDSTDVRFSGTVDVSNSHLASDGVQVVPLVNEIAPGRWLVGITRLDATQPGIDFTGSRELCRLVFTRVADSGTSTLGFDNVSLEDAQNPPQEIPGLTWTGGTFLIQ